jgi:hypothetical protein
MSFPIQDIFRLFFNEYAQKHAINYQQEKVALAIMNCKTPELGANLTICEDCGHTSLHYNSCRNRHCPCCQGLVKEKWVDKRKSEVVNTPYFHVVFTVPEELNPLIYNNQELLYSLFYKASSDTLLELAQNPKHLGASIGFMSLLHTWGQSISFHPHLHCIVLGGGLTKDLKFKQVSGDFLFPIRVLSKLFRGKFMDGLKTLYQQDKLIFSGTCAKYKNSYSFQELINLLYSKEWVPYIKEPFKCADHVIEYLGRYTHKIAISNSRIVEATKEAITFKIKDYKKGGASTTLSLEPTEFIRRFLMHVLPKGFVKIRHYGIFSNRTKRVKIKICRNILKGTYQKSVLEGLNTAQILFKLFGIDICKCPNCLSENTNSHRTSYYKRE